MWKRYLFRIMSRLFLEYVHSEKFNPQEPQRWVDDFKDWLRQRWGLD